MTPSCNDLGPNCAPSDRHGDCQGRGDQGDRGSPAPRCPAPHNAPTGPSNGGGSRGRLEAARLGGDDGPCCPTFSVGLPGVASAVSRLGVGSRVGPAVLDRHDVVHRGGQRVTVVDRPGERLAAELAVPPCCPVNVLRIERLEDRDPASPGAIEGLPCSAPRGRAIGDLFGELSVGILAAPGPLIGITAFSATITTTGMMPVPDGPPVPRLRAGVLGAFTLPFCVHAEGPGPIGAGA
jgi:hypothetical protein